MAQSDYQIIPNGQSATPGVAGGIQAPAGAATPGTAGPAVPPVNPAAASSPGAMTPVNPATPATVFTAAADLATTSEQLDRDQQKRVQAGVGLKLPQGVSELTGVSYFDHRGNPLLYQEHTLEAYRASLNSGSKFVECDCRLLADGKVAVHHDATVDRITDGTGDVASFTSQSFVKLTIPATHDYAATRPCLLDEVVREFGNKCILLLEAKVAGSAAKILEVLDKYEVSKDHVVVSSFISGELTGPKAAGWHVSLLLGTYAGSPSAATLLSEYGRVDVSSSTSISNLQSLQAAGVKVAIYTDSQRSEVSGKLGDVDAVFTDDAEYTSGRSARYDTDLFAQKTFLPGHHAINSAGENGGRGAFFDSDRWGYDMAAANTWAGALLGWAGPVGGAETISGTRVIEFDVTFESAFTADRFAWMTLADGDKLMSTDSTSPNRCYNFVLRKDGSVWIYSYNLGGGSVLVANTAGAAIADGATASYRITVTPSNVTLERTDVATVATAASTHNRGAYVAAGVKGAFAKFSSLNFNG